jgi:uncharacterized protein YbjT (DUF2867 family)
MGERFMNVLVTGGTGTVGSQVVQQLIARGVNVTVLTRDAAKARALPGSAGAVEGNLAEPATVRRVFEGMDAVFLVNSVSRTEAHEGLLSLCGMRLAGVKRVVYVSVQDADRAAWLPHFGSKAGVERALEHGGIPFTILRPNNFFQNDYALKDAILKWGVYPQPLGSAGLSRVDVRDIAEAAAVALTSGTHDGETYDLVGPDVVTGESTAAAWSQALGKPIRYGGDDLDAWEQQMLQFMPDWMVFDFKEMFRFFQEHGLKAAPGAIDRQTRLVGHAPRSFDAFAKETAAAWLAS